VISGVGGDGERWFKVQGRASRGSRASGETASEDENGQAVYSCAFPMCMLTCVCGVRVKRGVRGESTVALGVTREKEKKKRRVEGFSR
jgi:hypothetical protein